MSIHYSVRAEPHTRLFHVTLTIESPDPAGQAVSLPAWIPGSYMIRDFAKNIVCIEARCTGKPLAVTKHDKHTWHIVPCPGPIELDYSVYAWDLSVRGAHLDITHGYFNGTSLFLRVHGQDGQSCTIDLLPPHGDEYVEWHVATTLPRDGADENGFGRHRAADYDELIDHPVEMGRFTLLSFDACGTPHDVAVTGRHNADSARLATDLKAICEYHIRFFGEPAPMERYLFQVTAVGDGYGGLEHRSSTSLLCSRNDLPRSGTEDTEKGISDEYRNFLGLCSHEYFHTWNVKRIKPAEFIPYDLAHEVHTPLLWAFEGITSYYDDLALVRTGIISIKSYLEVLGQTITRLLRSGGRFRQSAAESSFDAWTKFYKADENAPNAIVSYYVKGAVIAFALDHAIRQHTNDARSLDDVMRALWERFGMKGVGVTEEAIEKLATEMAGTDLGPFFDVAVRGTDDLDLAPIFGRVGIEYHVRAAESQADKGGKPGKEDRRARITLGARTGDDPLGAKLVNVFDGGAAQLAGLAPGDVLVAVDGLRITHGNAEKRFATYSPGEIVDIHAFRRDELLRFSATLQPAPVDTCYLVPRDDADEESRKRLARWLGQA